MIVIAPRQRTVGCDTASNLDPAAAGRRRPALLQTVKC